MTAVVSAIKAGIEALFSRKTGYGYAYFRNSMMAIEMLFSCLTGRLRRPLGAVL